MTAPAATVGGRSANRGLREVTEGGRELFQHCHLAVLKNRFVIQLNDGVSGWGSSVGSRETESRGPAPVRDLQEPSISTGVDGDTLRGGPVTIAVLRR